MVMGSAVTAQDGLMTPEVILAYRLLGGKVIIKNGGKEITVDEYHHLLNRLLKFYPFPVEQYCFCPDLSPRLCLSRPLPNRVSSFFIRSNPCLLPAGFKDMEAGAEGQG